MEQLSLFLFDEEDGGDYAVVSDVTEIAANGRKWHWDRIDPKWLEIGGPAAKLDANITAITCLRAIENGGETTPDDLRVLSRYTGWGGLPQVFGCSPDSWAGRVEQVKALLNEKQWNAAKESTLNAHYTSPVVIQAMWTLVGHLGFTGGSILEPGCGVGYFAGFVPDEVDGNFTLVEQDPTSAAIAKRLYVGGGQATVVCGGFETVQASGFSLAIGNVPFGNYKLGGDNAAFGGFTIHNHFIAKAIDAVHPGGIVALITSSYTLDSKDGSHRQWFAERANLLGAIRLPSMAFTRIAGTHVTTDILVFQRPVNPADLEESPAWLDVATVDVDGQEGLVNRLYLDCPAAVIGKMALVGNAFGKSIGCQFDGSEDDLAAALAAQIKRFPQGVFDSIHKAADEGRVLIAKGLEPRFGYEVREGDALWLWEGLEAFPATGKDTARIIGMCAVRDAARAVLAEQQVDEASAEREALNTAYDALVEKYGALSSKTNRRVFRLDPDLPLLLSLERWDEESKDVSKTDIFWRNTYAAPKPPEVETVADAAAVSLAQFGRVDVARMASLLGEGWTPDRVLDEALQAGVLYTDPVSGELEAAERYLSGDVKSKLAQAKEAGPAFAGNVAALEAVIPDDIQAEQIDVQLGADWIPVEDYQAFLVAIAFRAELGYDPMAGWKVEARQYARCHRFGTDKVGVDRVLQAAMNGQDVRVTMKLEDGKSVTNMPETIAAREKLDEIKAAFVSWLWNDDQRAERLVRIYNDTYNRTVERQYDGSKLVLPGYSWALQPHRHQGNAVVRIVSESNTLLAHCVGAGKTLTMICGAMEAKRLGRISKPLFVVPNHMLYQFGAEFMRAYPQARVLLAEKDDLVGRRRLEFVARVATGTWDGVIMTHATFERIRMDTDFQENWMEAIISRIKEVMQEAKAERGNRAVKEIARALKTWESRLEKLLAESRKDNMIAFSDMGVDALFVDEAHLFKNLWRYSKMDRVAGLGSSNSQRAFDLLMKVRWIQEQRGKVVFATGTPVSNTMAEVWVMQHYLQPVVAGEFDAWANRYGRVVTNVEVAPDGSGFRMTRRFAQFVNVSDLMGAFRQVADIQTAEMLKLPVPEAVRHNELLPASEALKMYTENLVERATAIRNGNVDPKDDNMLLVTGCGRKAALALELVGYPSSGAETKVSRCAVNVVRTWEQTRVSRGTQLVFCDLSTPGDGWNVYDALKKELVVSGIPAAEIVYIHQAKTDTAKEALFEKVRAGEVRVLIGSTGKMGMGTNVQNRLVALHHLDAPWRPSDVEQREGRILRQGNGNDRVAIYRYVTEGSFDAYMWQTLETKATFIAQVMRGDALRQIDDLESGPLSYAEVKALASGNPMVMEKVRVDSDVARFTVLRGMWLAKQREARTQIALLPGRLDTLRGAKAEAETVAANVSQLPSPWVLTTPKGVALKEQEQIGDALIEAVRSVGPFSDKQVGTIGAFTVEARVKQTFTGSIPVLYVRHGGGRVEVTPTASGRGCVGRITIAFRDMLAQPEQIAERITRETIYMEQAKRSLQECFEHEGQLDAALRRQAEINRELGIAENDNAAVDIAA